MTTLIVTVRCLNDRSRALDKVPLRLTALALLVTRLTIVSKGLVNDAISRLATPR